ncbi:DUF4249 family protein [bacterium]|nr:DUF4249 family protein [bacterium]
MKHSVKQFGGSFIWSFAILLFLHCANQPISPLGEEEIKLSIFSVINPATCTQKLYASHTLTFQDYTSGNTENLAVDDISGTILGPDGNYEIIKMDYQNNPLTLQDNRYDDDFLWGSGRFNYIFDGPPIRFGQEYSLSLTSEELGEVSASTIIPGPFEITEISIEPELSTMDLILDIGDWGSNNEKYKPNHFRVVWSESEHAAAYWLDISVLEYDIPEDLQLNYDGTEYSWPDFGDSTRLLDIPYYEYPVYFRDSENNPVRGYLTIKNVLEMPLDDFLEMVDFPKDFEYRFEHTYRLRVHVHAVSESLYGFLANSSLEGEKVGQISIIPDISNISNGFGIFGSAYTQTVTARLYNYILQTESPTSQNGINYWYMQFNDVYTLDQIINDEFSRLIFHEGLEGPVIDGPENNTLLTADQPLTLFWEPIENVEKYLLVLKPHYLWFGAGNLAYILDENEFELSWEDIPYRDCQITWYVKGLSSLDHHSGYVIEPASDKAPLVFSNEIATPWSESRTIQTPSGEWPGFENQKPILLAPENSDVIAPNGTLRWKSIEGADAYLLTISTDQNRPVIAVTSDTLISPPFTNNHENIDGLKTISTFSSGTQYQIQLCALRVKAGTLAFSINESSNQGLPEIYSRYQHPSGIILKTQWSDMITFQVQ